MSTNHGFASRGIEILGVLAGKWGVDVDVQIQLDIDTKAEVEVGAKSPVGGGKKRDLFTADVRFVDDVQDLFGGKGGGLFSPFPLQGRPSWMSGGEDGEIERSGFVVRGDGAR